MIYIPSMTSWSALNLSAEKTFVVWSDLTSRQTFKDIDSMHMCCVPT